MKRASLAEIRYFCPKFWLNSLCDYVQNPKLTSDIIHDECWCSRLLLTFWLCLLGVSWGPLGGHFPNRRYFSQNIGIISYRTILRCLHTTIYEQGLKSSGNLRKSPEFRILQMPSNPQLFYSNAVFGQIWVPSGFFWTWHCNPWWAIWSFGLLFED